MRLLLDTCTFLWLVSEPARLSPAAAEAIQSADNEAFLSTVSAWEISLKHGLGRLPLPQPPETFVPRWRGRHLIESLPLDEESALHLRRLPRLHADPFDRMLVCQAVVHGLVIVTPDDAVRGYALRTLW